MSVFRVKREKNTRGEQKKLRIMAHKKFIPFSRAHANRPLKSNYLISI